MAAGRGMPEPQAGTAGRRWRRLLQSLASPDSYGLVLVLILVTYAVSVTTTNAGSWAASVVVGVQIATVWVTLRASRAHRSARALAHVALAVAAAAAIVNLFARHEIHGAIVVPWVSCLLYLIAPLSIARHLVLRRVIDSETLMGAIAAYAMVGMFFAFLYHASAVSRGTPPFFGSGGQGTFPQDLFFSFTTLTTTGYGDLVPAGNPGQTFAVAEMLIGQLFLVTAVGKVVSSWRPGQGRRGLRGGPGESD
jgi:hypothetical protein